MLRRSVLGQYFKDLGPKFTYLNMDLFSLKPSNVSKWVKYQNLMLLNIFKVRINYVKTVFQGNLSQAFSLKA